MGLKQDFQNAASEILQPKDAEHINHIVSLKSGKSQKEDIFNVIRSKITVYGGIDNDNIDDEYLDVMEVLSKPVRSNTGFMDDCKYALTYMKDKNVIPTIIGE